MTDEVADAIEGSIISRAQRLGGMLRMSKASDDSVVHSVPKGSSKAYRKGWQRVFGKGAVKQQKS